ncbi:MAG TPA: hypothetical protein VEQ59_14890, partial [Polyangiaceae bacterium]|nr:hypothetical protein [Polyangiaceae bacterium]
NLDLRALSPVEVFQHLAPQDIVPASLMAAYGRSQTLAFVDDSSSIEIEEHRLDGESLSERSDGLGQS